MNETGVVDPASVLNCEMIASCTSSWNSESCTLPRSNRRSARSSAEVTLSGLRFGSGDESVWPVETIWYSSAAVANRYALASAPVNVHSGDACQDSSAFGENLFPERVGCTQGAPA